MKGVKGNNVFVGRSRRSHARFPLRASPFTCTCTWSRYGGYASSDKRPKASRRSPGQTYHPHLLHLLHHHHHHQHEYCLTSGTRHGVSLSLRGREEGRRSSLGWRVKFRLASYRSRRNTFGWFERAYRWLEDNDLARRSLITAAVVITSRLCFLLPLPDLDRRFLSKVLDTGPLGAMKDPFGDLLQTPGNVFQLGFGAMIFSSIIVQVLVSTVPSLKQKTREGGTGEAFIKNMTLYIFLVAAVLQGLVTTHLMAPYMIFGSGLDVFTNLVCGSMILRTMCTLIDNFGIGDGFLNILVANIAAEYAVVFRFIFSRFVGGQIVGLQLLGLLASVAACILASIWLTASTDNLPIRYYSRDEDEVEIEKAYGAKEAYLPFKINPTGMQPIIIASYLLHLPSQLALAFGGIWYQFGSFFSQKIVYYPLYFSLLYLSAFIDINETSKEISLYLGKIGAIIPGVRPGDRTIEYVETFRKKTIRKGAGMLAVLGTFSIATEVYFRNSIGISLSLTSMLLMVSAFMQIRRQVTSYQQAPKLESTIRNYESLINSSINIFSNK